jgi:GxxExxY protein
MSNAIYKHKVLTGRLIGFAFDIYKQIGPRHPEKVYQKAYENKLVDAGFRHKRENYCRIEVDGKRVGSFYLDFVVEDKVVVELKVGQEIINQHIAQVLTYLKINRIELGLVLLFSKDGVKIKRLVL